MITRCQSFLPAAFVLISALSAQAQPVKGSVFAGGMAGELLVRLTLDGRRVTSEEKLVQRMGRIHDVRQGPDGYIYLAIDHREQPTSILRLEPVARN